MPAGLQIAAAPGRDELVLRLAAAYEATLVRLASFAERESGGRLVPTTETNGGDR
jgi:Asp-tRNA(Asn)/Glu-tRNA(Gln) amidotransferase A subunit family amidase